METNNNHYRWALFIICCLGFALRSYHINTYSLWCDEMLQITSALAEWKDIFYSFIWHTSPPLDYVLMKLAILLLGKADWAVRMPAFLFGVASIPVFYYFSRLIAGQKTAVFASALLAFSPMAISYSQEARMYSLFLLLSLISFIAALKLAEKNSFMCSLVLGLINGLLILTHYFGIFVIVYETFFLMSVLWVSGEKKRRLELLAASLLISLFMFLPWLPMFFSQLQVSWKAGYALQANIYFFENIFSRFSADTMQLDRWGYSYLFIFFSSIAIAWRKKSKKILFVALSVFGILGVFFSLSLFKKIVTAQNILFLLPLFLLVCAYGVATAFSYVKINLTIGVSIIVLLIFWPAISYHLAGPKGHKQPWKNAVQYIQQNIDEKEKIITTDALSRSFLAYYEDPEAEYMVMKSYWRIFKNEPSWKIWIINDDIVKKIKEKKLAGWVVIPSFYMGGTCNNYFLQNYRQLLGPPAKTFNTQVGPLQVFHLQTAH